MITNIKKYQAATHNALNLPEAKCTYNGKTCPDTSGELEDEFGLGWYHYGLRYQDPQLGRWHSPDPVHEFHSVYNYVGNNPINRIDPDGALSFSFFDDVFFNSETGEVDIVETDEPDQLFIDGQNVGLTNADFFRDGASIFNNFTDFFTQSLGRDLLNNAVFRNLFDQANRRDIRAGLLQARIFAGQNVFLERGAKGAAIGLGVVSGVGTGAGIAFGSSTLIGVGTTTSLTGNALSVGLNINDGNTTAALLNTAFMVISGVSGRSINHITSTSNFLNLSNTGGKTLEGSKLIFDQVIFNTIGAAENNLK